MKKNATHMLIVSVMVLFGLSAAPMVRAADDGRIEAAAKKTYVFRTQLTNDSIRVESKDGIVTLTGTASSASHKSLAEDTVRGLPGVVSVDNRLEVKAPPPAREMSDQWIGAKVKLALLFHRSVSAMTDVDVQDGVVTLRGAANSAAERDLATEYAKDVDGVKRVNNEMTIAPKPPTGTTMGEHIDDASITAQVKFSLLNRRSTSALRTSVETKNGAVTLRGQAKNQAEIDLVTKLVRDITGVKSVNNEMTIEKPTS